MNDQFLIKNLNTFEFALLIILTFVSLYFIYLAVREYRNSKTIRTIGKKINAMMAGDYSDAITVKGDSELVELGNNVNDLSDVLRLTHEHLSQERNRLASVLSYMSDGVLATNRVGKIIMINEMAQSQLNLSRKEAMDMNIMDLIDNDRYSFRDLITKTPEINLERRNEFDEFVTLRVNFALNRRESGFISGLVAVFHDMTEQEKEERERRLFVSTVSHELRTPLTSVKSYLEALDEGALQEDIAPSFIKVSLDETNRMMRMVSDLLQLSRIDNGNARLDVEMINFTAFMDVVLDRFDQIKIQQDQDKDYVIVRNYASSPVWVEIDTDKMTQVLDNILNNAIKYSPDGGEIAVLMTTTESQLIISISDQGLGIPKKDLPMIFDRFYRVDKARSRAQGGTGLGLSIAKEIIKQHDGFIWAKSEYGEGSTFTIVLPYDKAAGLEDDWGGDDVDHDDD